MVNAAILLAAGRSSRMGATKSLLKWGRATLLEEQVKQIVSSGISELIIVTGYDSERLEPYLKEIKQTYAHKLRLSIVHNQHYERGKTSSIRLGISSIHDYGKINSITIIGVDQPVRLETLSQLVQELNKGDIIIPSYNGKKGHPPIFSGTCIDLLSCVNEEHQGLRQVITMKKERVRIIEVPEPQVLLNLNYIQDYRRARRKGMDMYE